MEIDKKSNNPGFIRSVLNHKCPRCRSGNMFQTNSSYNLKNFMKMNKVCPLCGQRMEIEIGFYYGTSYVSYVISILLSVATFVAWWILIGISLNDNRVFWWMGVNIVILVFLQPYLMRFSRTLWLSFFVRYNPNWNSEKAEEPERIVVEQMNNW